MKWNDGEPFPGGPMLMFQVDMENRTKDTFIGRCDETGSMVDPAGEDIGWESDSVSRWILLNTVLASFIE